ncbi:uncharacterized protein B0I36DRAFT_350616 [Microdochium trichocladiopsis]|uniref:Uncharacterized protein n=1 Tax=Microdochium trichocladiopsis TaxID=1682393 RepID=A0A9P8Y583_9PEZI|nr:uncharacterized protein B0I36DRAFT_350616 [Microdochium trichocladiopsis]KAH7029807.1 hypothetical protein B0I36DRAFT_350616 [Microdochium trichocladiopsis]
MNAGAMCVLSMAAVLESAPLPSLLRRCRQARPRQLELPGSPAFMAAARFASTSRFASPDHYRLANEPLMASLLASALFVKNLSHLLRVKVCNPPALLTLAAKIPTTIHRLKSQHHNKPQPFTRLHYFILPAMPSRPSHSRRFSQAMKRSLEQSVPEASEKNMACSHPVPDRRESMVEFFNAANQYVNLKGPEEGAALLGELLLEWKASKQNAQPQTQQQAQQTQQQAQSQGQVQAEQQVQAQQHAQAQQDQQAQQHAQAQLQAQAQLHGYHQLLQQLQPQQPFPAYQNLGNQGFPSQQPFSFQPVFIFQGFPAQQQPMIHQAAPGQGGLPTCRPLPAQQLQPTPGLQTSMVNSGGLQAPAGINPTNHRLPLSEVMRLYEEAEKSTAPNPVALKRGRTPSGSTSNEGPASKRR